MEEIKEKEEIKTEDAPDMTNTAPAVEEAPAAPEAKDEEPVDEIADELREAMTAAGLDPADKAAQKAFIAGMSFAKAADEKPAEDACKDAEVAQDSAPVFDKATASALYTAAEEVAPFIGKIANPFAFDSAADIYRKALDAKNVDVANVDPSAYGAMVKMLGRNAAPVMDAAPVDDDPINKMLKGIKSR